MQMRQQPPPNEDHANTEGNCDECNSLIQRFRGQDDLYCECGAIYNCGGQRLRDDLNARRNPSEYDEDIDDLTGYELAQIRAEERAMFRAERG